jgi:hypothetical protein
VVFQASLPKTVHEIVSIGAAGRAASSASVIPFVVKW